MKFKDVYSWIRQSEYREKILLHMKQPMTARQLSVTTQYDRAICSIFLWQFGIWEVAELLNGNARRSRLYKLTRLGIACQKKLRREMNLPELSYFNPSIDWGLYGWVCFRHRASILRVLTEPLQPSEIKRRAIRKVEKLRMSANNVRDIMKLFLARKIVQKVQRRKRAHPRYELTETGQVLRQLLLNCLA